MPDGAAEIQAKEGVELWPESTDLADLGMMKEGIS
jgi:hypothetical protein